MDDYYDYYISRPPQGINSKQNLFFISLEKGKALDFYPDIEEDPEMAMDSKYGTVSLSAITETEKESMATSESYQRK